MLLPFFKKQRTQKNDKLLVEFIEESKKRKVGLKSALIEYEAMKRGLSVQRLSNRITLINSKSGSSLAFVHMNGISSSRIGNILCDRKQDSRIILKRNNISVVESKVFQLKEFKNAANFAKKIGFPIVVKPTTLSRGRGITTNIQNPDELKLAWEKGAAAYPKNKKIKNLMIEKHVVGDDYRFFVVDGKLVSASLRKRANVVGDGISTISDLIAMKNRERKKNPYLSSFLIPEDVNELDMLRHQNLNLDSIPEKGKEIILRSQSNLSAGGDSIDVTDSIHPGFKKIAIKSVQVIPGIDYAGVDFITRDITKKPTESNYIVGEIEFSPAPFTHFPFKGKSRNMAGAIIDYYLKKG